MGFHNQPLTRYKHKREPEDITLLKGPRDALVDTSSLKELSLKYCCDWVALETDPLKIPRALEKLTCDFRYSGRLIPKATTAALRPLYSALVFLNLSYFVTPGDRGITERGADFSSFICLKTLIIDGFLFFESWSSDRSDVRCGFYDRLPSALGILKASVFDVPNLFVCLELMTLTNVVIVARWTLANEQPVSTWTTKSRNLTAV